MIATKGRSKLRAVCCSGIRGARRRSQLANTSRINCRTSSSAIDLSLESMLDNNNNHYCDNNPTTFIPANYERSDKEIQRLVQQRVQEQKTWKVHGRRSGAMTPGRELVDFTSQVLPSYLKFRFVQPPPPAAHLDQEFPVLPLDWHKLQNPPSSSLHPKIQITWLGHAACLVQMNGCNILTDPHFSPRSSATQWLGRKRYRPPPCTIKELCNKVPIHAVLISHNHYDHLDYTTVCELRRYAGNRSPSIQFVVPLGVRTWFRKYICRAIPVYEQDWHETCEIQGSSNSSSSDIATSSSPVVRVTSLPMRHWSNRTGKDRDKTLWCGYSIATAAFGVEGKKFLFTGDTAWFDGLEDLTAQYGPWDVAAIPIGAGEPRDFMKHKHKCRRSGAFERCRWRWRGCADSLGHLSTR